ncbi:Protein of unknown function [Gracilibacillus kekensis]|uniref:Uncharacterized protein n=2 Tax=Gracilibacillus kekensis TaxID=1027249 RepID=A0A1M7Q295_9BACI|nr:Protein of unknown function [Gracilibacillus kekensis]
MVESIGEIHFYTYAIIPIDKKQETVLTHKIWTQEMVVEDAIMTGIYGLVEQEKFENLTKLIDELNQEFSLTGLNEKASQLGANRFSTEYYYTAIGDEKPFGDIVEYDFKDPNRTTDEWEDLLLVEKIDAEAIRIAINLYMADENVEPDSEVFDTLIQRIERADNIPKGIYGLSLHDNYILKKDALGSKENSLSQDSLI